MNYCIKCKKEIPDGAPYCPWCGKQQQQKAVKRQRGNGLGTAFKRGATWTGQAAGYSYARENEDGTRTLIRRRPTKGGFATKKEALLWASTQQGQIETQAPRLIDLWESYSKNDMQKLSKKKQQGYRTARNRLDPIMGRRIDALTLDEMQDLLNRECKTYYTAKDVRDLLSNLYKRAMASNTNRGKVTQNLSQFLILPDFEETAAEPFTEDEIYKIWDLYHAGTIFAGYILLLIYTGMMPGELMQCEKAMVDLEKGEIRGTGAKTKTRRNAVIVYPDFLRPVMESLMERTSPNGNAKKEKLLSINKDNFYKEYYATIEAAGCRRLAPYACRHTYATEAVKLGLHPEVIKKMLRHSNTKMQERYTHLADKDVQQAVNQLPVKKETENVSKEQPEQSQ